MIKSYENELEQNGKLIFTIKGISMRPLFHADKDAILVKKCAPETLKTLDIVLFRRGKQYVLHRIVDRDKSGLFVIAGDNCSAADIVRPEDILGVVTSAQRCGKPIKLDGRIYLKLWCSPYKLRFGILCFRDKARGLARKLVRR